MKKIIFISKEFHPRSNGTVACLENIFTFLSKSYEVNVCSCREFLNSPKYERRFGVAINRFAGVWDYFVFIKRFFLRKYQQIHFSKVLQKMLILLNKIFFFPWQFLAKRKGFIEDSSWAIMMHKTLYHSDLLCDADIIMAISELHQNFAAAVSLKQAYPEKKLVLIMFDLYTYNPVSILNDEACDGSKTRYEEEYEWFKYADAIIVAQEMYDILMQSGFVTFKKKMHSFFIPSLFHVCTKDEISTTNSEIINIVYSGSLYRDIRNPEYILSLFENVLGRNRKIHLHFYGGGCEDILYKYKKRLDSQLILHGNVSRDNILAVIKEANILLNIGNATPNQLPSKIFEYIGTCKPIINAYSIENDTCEKYLQQYPCKLSIYEDIEKSQQQVNAIYNFINENCNYVCKSEEVSQIYEEYTAERFTEKLENVLRNLEK